MKHHKNNNLVCLVMFIIVFVTCLVSPAASDTSLESNVYNSIDEYFYNAVVSHNPTDHSIEKIFKVLPRFGLDFFDNVSSDYGQLDSIPVNSDYVLGIEDELTISLFGIPDEESHKIIIDRNGMASVPHIGAVRLAGYSIQEAYRILQSRFNQYFRNYQLEISLGNLHSITVYVTGNAKSPGAYSVASSATLVTALLLSGGPSDTGSMRRIELKRYGETVAIFDMYAMLLRGDKSNDVHLENGDIIFIRPVGELVGFAGEVQTPAIYELNGKTRVKDLMYIAGGYTAKTFKGRIQYFKVQNNSYRIAQEGSFNKLKDLILADGDLLRLFPIFNMISTVTINGQVANPGEYTITPGVTRLSEIISLSGGLLKTASNKAYVTRVKPSLHGSVNERFEINLQMAMGGDIVNDFVLEQGDKINILVIPDWKTQLMVTIEGEVKWPGTYALLKGEKISDLIKLAGGFTDDAYTKGIVFTRKSVAKAQKEALEQVANQLERDLYEPLQSIVTNEGDNAQRGRDTAVAYEQEVRLRLDLVRNLRNLDIIGRLVVKVDKAMKFSGTKLDLKLQDGDTLTVPEIPDQVNVMGAVYVASSHVYEEKADIDEYIINAGGPTKSAHKRMLYIVKPDGTVVRLTKNTSALTSKQWRNSKGQVAKIDPGDTIIVPIKYINHKDMDLLEKTVDIIYKVAVATGIIISL